MSLACSNCGVTHGADDLFCESCGYDFITGSLPSITADDAPVPHTLAPPSATPIAQITVTIEVDHAYFEVAVSGGDLNLPDPLPDSVEVVINAVEVHIGRTSESRGVHPHIDIAAMTQDPAVSSRHAVLRAGHAGQISITDLGSTNGTVLGEPASEPITPNLAVDLEAHTWVYLGAWTRLKAHIG
jgi:hypothetical protein